MQNLSDYAIQKFCIPFYHAKVVNWEKKRQNLLDIYTKFAKPIYCEQWSDYDESKSNTYINLVENVLLEDIKLAASKMGKIGKLPRIKDAWFQVYNYGDSHPIHNHGYKNWSMVCFIKFNPSHHRPTRFIAPFSGLFDGNIMEYEPEVVDEGTIICFSSSLAHFVPANQSNVERMILSSNIC